MWELCGNRVTVSLPGGWKEESLRRDIWYQGAEYHPIWRIYRKDSSALIKVDFGINTYQTNKKENWESLHYTVSQKRSFYSNSMEKVKFSKDTIVKINSENYGIVEAVYFDEYNDRYIYQLDAYTYGNIGYLSVIAKSYEQEAENTRATVMKMLQTLKWKNIEKYFDCYATDTFTVVPKKGPRGVIDRSKIY